MVDLTSPELLALPPLAIAAGLDLYLTLLFIGAAPTIGLWPDPLPGALGDLDSVGVLAAVGAFYLFEFAAERFPLSGLVWNSFHAVIRPLSSGLLALLLLDGQPPWLIASGVAIAAVLASAAHGVRSGAAVLRWLGAGVSPSVLLVSVAEDIFVLGLASLALDRPAWALTISLVLVAGVAPLTPSMLRAFRYAVRLVTERIAHPSPRRRWRGHDELPDWVAAGLAGDDVLAPGGALRGAPAGGWKVGGARRFLHGWVVVRGGAPVFVHRRRGAASLVDLGGHDVTSILDQDLFRRIDLSDGRGGGGAFLLLGSAGPSVESLKAEFQPH